MMVPAIIINARPEIGTGRACGPGYGRRIQFGIDSIQSFEMPRRLGEHRSFAPFSCHADASLLICPVIHLIAPLTNPQGLAAVVSRVLHIPSVKTWDWFTHAVAGGIAAFDRELLVNDTVKIRRNKTVVGLV